MRWFVLACFLTALVVGQEEELDDRYGNLKHLNDNLNFFCGVRDPYDVLFSILWRVLPAENIEIDSRRINYIKPFAFEECLRANCETLRITNTDIYTINGDMLYGLQNVTKITLFNNNLDTIRNGTFNRLTRLTELELSYNSLNGLDDDVCEGLKKLTALHLNRNPIVLKKNRFAGLPKLELLELTGANITNIPTGTFNGLEQLRRLDLSSNNLTSLLGSKFERLTQLEELDLSFNSISTIKSSAFKGLTNLKDLWLNDNQISMLISYHTFNGIKNLENLYLHNNPLLVLNLAVFKNMPIVAIEPGFNITTPEVVQKNFSNSTSISVTCQAVDDYFAPYNCLVNYGVHMVIT